MLGQMKYNHIKDLILSIYQLRLIWEDKNVFERKYIELVKHFFLFDLFYFIFTWILLNVNKARRFGVKL